MGNSSSHSPQTSPQTETLPFGFNVLEFEPGFDLAQANFKSSTIIPSTSQQLAIADPLNTTTQSRTPPRTPVERSPRPIDDYLAQIKTTIEGHQFTIISAETGAGKSLGVPQMLAQSGKQVVVTEPRIIAAKSLAARAADEMGEILGERVGYRTALYRSDSPNTQLLYCTDGLEMVRRLAGRERRCDVLVIDEIHEWNTNMEVLLAWVKAQAKENPQMRVVIMSATVDHDRLKDYLGIDTATIQVPGRTHPVTQRQAGHSIEEDVAKLVREGRNVLVFQPGKREIEGTIETLRRMKVNAEILPCHGDLTLEEQDLVFKSYGKPKIVVATNVAQTSITIPDIDAVVDSGLERRIETVNGIEGLYLGEISKADSAQRRGRAGRTKPGIYIDHCPKDLHGRPDFPIPEMKRVRPDQAVLRLLEAGIDIEEFEIFHAPHPREIRQAKETLKTLGCIDNAGAITPLGIEIAKLPCSVEGGRMLVEASKRGVLHEVVTAVAILEAGNLLDYKSDNWFSLCRGENDSDILAMVKVFEGVESELKKAVEDATDEKEALKEICDYYGVKEKVFNRAREARELLIKHLGFSDDENIPSTHQHSEIVKSIASGLVEHVYRQINSEERLYQNGGSPRRLSKFSVVDQADWIVGLPFDLEVEKNGRTKVHELVTRVSRIDPQWLAEVAPQLIKVEDTGKPRYSERNDKVFFARGSYCGVHKIDEEFYSDPNNPISTEVFAEWLAEMTLSSSPPKKVSRANELREVWEHNRECLREAENARREGKLYPENDHTKAGIKEKFLKLLGEASSLTEIEDLSIFSSLLRANALG